MRKLEIKAPFPWFGGKRTVADDIWQRLGEPRQYIEPFFGSGAVLLASPSVASLEVVCDVNGFLANFWRAVSHQPDEVAKWADYPVSHIDLGARHPWLMEQRDALGAALQDPNWAGDAKIAGWWLWGQCCWIGSGWCDWFGQIPQISNAGRGVQAAGQIPQISNAGRGVQAAGQIPQISNAGRGVQAAMRRLRTRLERVRIVHGDWSRCLNHYYGGDRTAVVLDPPYRAYEGLYRCDGVADEVEQWAGDHAHLRVALCGHLGDYDLDGWEVMQWSRPGGTYSGFGTKDAEAIWFSPACLGSRQGALI